MTAESVPRRPLSGPALGSRLRIVTGLILFAFAATHFLNHALGLVSLEAMEAVRSARVAVTRSLPGTAVLLAAALTHLWLGCMSFLRRGLRSMRPVDVIQIGFGLLIPLLLARHVIGTRLMHELFGIDDRYEHALTVMWPAEGWRQALLMLLVWVHGTIGIHMWLKFRPWYGRAAPWLLGAAALIPALGYAGFVAGAREVALTSGYVSPITQDQYATFLWLVDRALIGYGGLLVVMVGYRLGRTAAARFAHRFVVDYGDGQRLAAAPGPTLLDISRANNIPHASVCGGRARCSTCRVRVIEGLEWQPPASELEQRVLERVGATGNVRLACQLRPQADLKVVLLLPAHRATAEELAATDKYFWGVEQKVTLMFADLRGFTRLSESHLPFDVVFLLNQYLGRMSEAITDSGGYVDKFMGDGIMAIFGMDRPLDEGARQALAAARAMSGVLDALNLSLRSQIEAPLSIAIGIHTGEAILGRIGVASGTGAGERITALGDTVNTASRLEGVCKELGVELVVSAATLAAARVARPPAGRRRIAVRGKRTRLEVVAVPRAIELAVGPGEPIQSR